MKVTIPPVKRPSRPPVTFDRGVSYICVASTTVARLIIWPTARSMPPVNITTDCAIATRKRGKR
jgi:hypothetical protein